MIVEVRCTAESFRVGAVLWEGAVYDEDGQLLTGTMLDYALPRADALPEIQVQSNTTPSPHHRWG